MTVSRETPVETRILLRDRPFSAREIAHRMDPAGYAQGVAAGHEDALAHLEPMIRDCVGELLFARQRRDQSHRESTDLRVWTEAAERERGHLQRLLFIRRVLKAIAPLKAGAR
ncbi:MAG TPA: hypothetical protein VEW95_09355 [Candidatus Limnocylindrales bacterium]|nr:hypothetical protein [Candidatus Limnocylindrales bacterium]